MHISSYHHAPIALSRYPLNMRLGGHQSGFGRVGRDKNFFSLPVFYRSLVATPTSLLSSPLEQQSPLGQFLLIIEDLWSHSDTPHSVGFLWTSDQPDAETSTWQHTTLTTDRHPCPRHDSNPQFQQASGRRPTYLHRAATAIGDDTVMTVKVP